MWLDILVPGIIGIIGVAIGTYIGYLFNKRFLKYNLFTETQFKLYNSLWASLVELRSKMDELWDLANEEKLLAFSKTLKKVLEEIEKNRLLLNETDYQNLKRILALNNFKIGKKKIIELRLREDVDINSINELIEQNRKNREDYLNLLKKLYGDFKKIIKPIN